MRRSLHNKILKALQREGIVGKPQLKAIQKEAFQNNERDLIKSLIEKGIISDRDLLAVLSQEMDIPLIDLTRITLTSQTMSLIPEKFACSHCVVPLSKIGDAMTLVVYDPTDIFAIDDVKTITGCNVALTLATQNDIQGTLQTFYKGEEEDISDIIGKDEDSDVEFVNRTEGFDVVEMTKESTAAPIVKIVDLIISEAIKKKASDIHVEPQEKSLRIRYRIDGELHSIFDLPKKNQNAILARIKIMSKLDITETRTPQDGRFRVKSDGKEIDFRVSILPLVHGNKIVMRALDKSNLSVGLEALGFLPEPLADFKEALSHPFGIILVTGPTGSGKSTTLYSIINDLNTPERNIVTVEDPVEYQVEGITQIAARSDIGLDFANGLRALLRQTPDIILVGEIRDFETADTAIKASLTGQMVLSTLHTNDAVGAITRLVNMGIEPFLIASSLVMSCAQRLLRRICSSCRVEIEIPEDVKQKIGEKYPEIFEVDKFYKGTGCSKCNGTGYKGRIGTLETMLIDDELKNMINIRKTEDELKQHLSARGMKTLRDNAMTKFFKGWTTLEEVMRVT